MPEFEMVNKDDLRVVECFFDGGHNFRVIQNYEWGPTDGVQLDCTTCKFVWRVEDA